MIIFMFRILYDFQLQSIGDVPIEKIKITIKEHTSKNSPFY